jgi:hypothetical protein
MAGRAGDPAMAEDALTVSERLAAIQDISILKARYFRCIDTKDCAQLESIFTPDATLHYTEVQDEPLGIAETLAFISSGMEGCVSIHHGHMPEVEILGPDRATGVWAMEDRLFWPSGRESRLGLSSLHGCGHYYEDYVRSGGRWLIHRLKLVRLWVQSVPPALLGTGDRL